jgi:hypothetical protein
LLLGRSESARSSLEISALLAAMIVPCAIAVMIALSLGLAGNLSQGRVERDLWPQHMGEAWLSYEDAYHVGWQDGYRAGLERLSTTDTSAYSRSALPKSSMLDAAIPLKPPKDPQLVGRRQGWRAGCLRAVHDEAGYRGDWCRRATHRAAT